MSATLYAAFVVGVLGSLHCVGMCGGIVGALCGATPQRSWTYTVAYHIGRLASYAAAGAIVGGIGGTVVHVTEATLIARFISALFLIALGLYLGGWWAGLAGMEKAGMSLWRWLQPLGKHLLPIDRPVKALYIGMLWGWLPCGMVYVALAGAVVSGDTATGAGTMMAFGAGTLPALVIVGRAADFFNRAIRWPGLRQTVGVVLIILGVVAIGAVVTPIGSVRPIHHQHV